MERLYDVQKGLGCYGHRGWFYGVGMCILRSARKTTKGAGGAIRNECGTIGSPTDCLAKELPQHSYTGPTSVYQVTLKIEGGAYETWACVLETDLRDNINDFIKWHTGADFNEAWSCGGDEGNDGPAIIDLVAGQKYRFARKGNTITFRPFKSFDKVSYGAGSPTVACYFMLLSACGSIHDCQDVPRHMVFGDGWRQAVAPDEYGKYDEYMKIKEQRENDLNTPR